MMFIYNVIPLLASMFTSVFTNSIFIPIFALAFLASVPCFLRLIFRR